MEVSVDKYLVWIYIVNLTFLILHEMDSAYWKEWNLFGMKGGLDGFLWIHVPVWILALAGLHYLSPIRMVGLFISIFLSLCGIAALFIHKHFLRKGHSEFNTPTSKTILWSLFLLSIIQGSLSVALLSTI